MRKKYRNKSPPLADHEKEDPFWWLQHHKQNVLYLVIRIQELLDAKDDGDKKYEEFFEAHFRACLKDFARSVGADLEPNEVVPSAD